MLIINYFQIYRLSFDNDIFFIIKKRNGFTFNIFKESGILLALLDRWKVQMGIILDFWRHQKIFSSMTLVIFEIKLNALKRHKFIEFHKKVTRSNQEQATFHLFTTRKIF